LKKEMEKNYGREQKRSESPQEGFPQSKTQSDPSMERIIDRMCDSGSDLCAAVQFIKRF